MNAAAITQTRSTVRAAIPNNHQHRFARSSLWRSPLRYPGGKSRAVKTIMQFIPQNINRICSPFVGGASIELACAARGIEVFAYDAFPPLVNFWQVLLAHNSTLADEVSTFYPLPRTKFYSLQKNYGQIDNSVKMAAVFFVLNRSSFSGTTLSGGMSPGHLRFTPSSIGRLRNFRAENFHIELADYKNSINKHPHDFLYLDPPYANGGALYGDRGNCHLNFDHDNLAAELHRRDGWILSYNDCEQIRDLYSGCKILTPTWAYGMSNGKKSDEVLILSHDLPASQ